MGKSSLVLIISKSFSFPFLYSSIPTYYSPIYACFHIICHLHYIFFPERTMCLSQQIHCSWQRVVLFFVLLSPSLSPSIWNRVSVCTVPRAQNIKSWRVETLRLGLVYEKVCIVTVTSNFRTHA